MAFLHDQLDLQDGIAEKRESKVEKTMVASEERRVETV
jgi:hypothetical protein